MALARSHSEVAEAGAQRLWFGWVMALTATLSFSVAPVVTRGAILAGIAPATLLMARMILSTLVLGGYILLFTPDSFRIDRRGLTIAIAIGMFNALGFLAFFTALTRLSASIASMIFTLNPLVVLLLLALRGERFTRRHGVRLILGIGGVYLLIGPSGQVDLIGAFLVIATVIIFATQLVSIQWFLRGYDAWSITFYMVLGIMFVSVGWWLTAERQWADPGPQGWSAIIALALVSTFLARLAMFTAVRYLGSGQVSLTVPLETLLSILWSMLFLQERLTPWQWAGGTLILTSMILALQRLRFTGRRIRWRNWSRV